MPVVESNGSEPFAAKALRERLEAAGLNASEPVRHHDGRVRAMPIGLVYPRFQVLSRSRRNMHSDAENRGVVTHSHQAPMSERCCRAQASSLIGGRPSSIATVS